MINGTNDVLLIRVLDARALLDLSRGTALKIFAENVYENENSKKLIISDKEDIEKVGDVGKEVGREALGNVKDDKVDVIVNVLYLENLKLVIELESTSSCSLFYRNQILTSVTSSTFSNGLPGGGRREVIKEVPCGLGFQRGRDVSFQGPGGQGCRRDQARECDQEVRVCCVSGCA